MLVLLEARKGCQVPGSRSYRCLPAARQQLGTDVRSFGRAASASSHRAFSPPIWFCVTPGYMGKTHNWSISHAVPCLRPSACWALSKAVVLKLCLRDSFMLLKVKNLISFCWCRSYLLIPCEKQLLKLRKCLKINLFKNNNSKSATFWHTFMKTYFNHTAIVKNPSWFYTFASLWNILRNHL